MSDHDHRTEHKITARQMEDMVALTLISSTVVTGSSDIAEQDTWFCMLVAFALVIPMLWVHSQILELYPGRDYYGNILRACGPVAGKAVLAALLLYSLLLGSMYLRVFGEFIHTLNMPETPLIVILCAIAATVIYTLKNRLYVVARLSKFMILVLIFSILISGILGIGKMDFNNLKPVLQRGFEPIYRGSLLIFALPMGEVVACGPLFGGLDRKSKIFPTLLKGTVIAVLALLFANVRNLLILGRAATIFTFVSYECVSTISIGEFLTRFEVLIGFNLLLGGFVKTCVFLFSTCEGVAKLFGMDDYEPLAAPCMLLMLTISQIVYANMEEVFNCEEYLPYASLPFQVALPVAVLIVGKIRLAGKKKRRKPKKQVCTVPSAESGAAQGP